MIRVCLLPALVLAGLATNAQTTEARLGDYTARFEGPTDRYGHAIMGNLPEWSRLCLEGDGAGACVTLPETSVFEDIAPRLADMDGDGVPEAVVVESNFQGGAALAVYRLEADGLSRTATPPIGLRNRWLSPVGIADFDQDGTMDVAYVETPHLGKLLKIYSWRDEALVLIAKASGLSNHRIGEETITSGIRSCGKGPEIVLPDGAWQRVFAGRFVDGTLTFEQLGPFTGTAGFQDYLAC